MAASPEAPYIICDSNHAENGVHDRLVALAGQASVRRQRLDVGDFAVVAGSTRIIIERKSSADLAASLQDGRCREQKTRQLAAVAQDPEGKTRVVWLIEGQLSGWHASMPPPRCFPVKQIETALVCTAVRDNIPVLRAKDQESVAETIYYMFTRARDGKLDGADEAQRRVAAGYGAAVHVKKAKNKDSRTTWIMMLSTISGVSSAKATAVAEIYPSPRSLVRALRNLDDKTAVKLLASIESGSRKLGPMIAKRLLDVIRGDGGGQAAAAP